MKIARLNNLERNNEAFAGGESDSHFEARRIIVVADNYDFQANDATDITTPELISEIVKKRYEDHKENGLEYFNSFRAGIVTEFYTGSISEAEVYELEEKLSSILAKVIVGDFMSAKNDLLNNVTVGGALTQSRYDEVEAYLNDYILNNY